MADPKVSVILPTYNRAHLLPRAIESVFSQTSSDWELIVVDDGSTDETPQGIRPYLADPRVRFIRKEGEGVTARTRNAGVRIAQGEYVAFLDDDDLFLPEKLERQVAWMDAHPPIGLLYSSIQVVDGEMKPLRVMPPNPGRSFLELFQENFIQVAAVLVRRKCFDRVGFFDESLSGSEDYLMWLKIAGQFPIDYLPEPLAIYCRHGENKSRNIVRQLQNRLHILNTFPVNRTRGLTRSMKNRSLAVTHYQLARELREAHDYFEAGRHFLNASRLDPTIGAVMKQPSPKGPAWVLQLLKPYGGLLYCMARGCLHPRGAHS